MTLTILDNELRLETSNPEYHVLYSLTQKPKLITAEDIQPEWFPKPYDTMVEFLQTHNTIGSYFELRDALDAQYPHKFGRKVWDAVLEADITTANYHTWVRVLEHKYMRAQARQAMTTALNEPTDENNKAASDALQNLVSHPNETPPASLSDLGDAVVDRINNPEDAADAGIKTIPQLDDILGDGLLGGRLLTIGARPAVGKSAFAINLIMHALDHQPDLTVDLFSLEMTGKEIYNRMLSYETGIEGRRLIKMPFKMTDKELAKIKETTSKLRRYDFQPWDNQSTLGEITSTIRERQATAKHQYLAVVDYLGLISVPGQSDRRLQIEQITRQLKVLTQQLNIPIVMLSQLSRQVEYRGNARPQLSDLRESGSIEQDSNEVAFLYNSSDDGQKPVRSVTLTFAKNREGALGDIDFYFHADEMRFQVAFRG